MNILDLLKKYESKDSIDYLMNIVKNEDYLIGLFESTMNIKHIINDVSGDFKFFEIFHRIYKNIENDNTIDNTILNCLIILESYYDVFNKTLNKVIERRKKALKLNTNEIHIKSIENISNMYNINTLPKNYEYYSLAKQVNSDIEDFSLDKIFNHEDGFNYLQDLNGVTLITPNQTISRLNDDSINGLIGSGHHDDNFNQILEAVYGRTFFNYTSGQDIKISYSASIESKDKLRFNMIVQVPLIINSAQKESLSILNNEIKKLENLLQQEINVHSVIIDYESKDYIKYIENKENLDEVLFEVIVDDLFKPKYKEICFIGCSNLENNYVKKYSYSK